VSAAVAPVAGALGAEVSGVDLRDPVDDADLAVVRAALADHLVIFVPGQALSIGDLETLTERLGGWAPTPYIRPVDGHPAVIRVVKEAGDRLNFANAWHSDLSYLPEPPSYTLLHAADVPDFGGDTVWANQYLAYETLSAGLRATLDGLAAVHSAGAAYGTGGLLDRTRELSSMAVEPSPDAYAEHRHPVVITHPVTGRRALYVNPVYTKRIDGWSAAESRGLLEHLFAHSVGVNLTCRLRWAPGTLAIWDNRCTQHNALNDYQGVRRELLRTSVRGAAPR